jgi:hypothetical protein
LADGFPDTEVVRKPVFTVSSPEADGLREDANMRHVVFALATLAASALLLATASHGF